MKNSKNRVVIILPYFGHLPNYFNLWLYSAYKNEKFDFIVFTDQSIEDNYINVKIINISFEKFKMYFQNIFDFQIALDSPYKLCDYKPAYGMALEKYIKDYEFWGYCDADIILGNLSEFITDSILDNNNRLYTRGHLTMFRNNKRNNELFMVEHKYDDCFNYRYVYNTNFGCAYDEWGTKYGKGLSEILNRNKYISYDSLDFADVEPVTFEFTLRRNGIQEIKFFEYNDGKIVGYDVDDNIIEFAYVHLQKRAMEVKCKNIKHYYIIPNYFSDTCDYENETFYARRKKFYQNYRLKSVKRKMQKIREGALIHLFDRYLSRINRR